MLDNLLSKVIAAGLAAGVFLLWWPAHLPATGVQFAYRAKFVAILQT